MSGPLEFRIVTEPVHDVKEYIPNYWTKLIAQEFHKDEEEEEDEDNVEGDPPVYWPWTVAAVMVMGSVLTNKMKNTFFI